MTSRLKACGAALGGALVAITWGAPSSAVAQDIPEADLLYDCTLDNVAGVYGFNEETLVSAETNQPIGLIGILELLPDGTAAIQFEGFLERNGDPVIGDVFEGTWEVEPTCLGLIDFPRAQIFGRGTRRVTVDYQFVAVENATELFLIRNNPLEKADAKLLFRR